MSAQAPAAPGAPGAPAAPGAASGFLPPSVALCTVGLAMAAFMQVLDTTIANVSLPTIAGNLGASSQQATWVITSFAVSTAIALPLTGWLSRRFRWLFLDEAQQDPDALAEVIARYRGAGGRGRLALQLHLSWAPTLAEADAFAAADDGPVVRVGGMVPLATDQLAQALRAQGEHQRPDPADDRPAQEQVDPEDR